MTCLWCGQPLRTDPPLASLLAWRPLPGAVHADRTPHCLPGVRPR